MLKRKANVAEDGVSASSNKKTRHTQQVNPERRANIPLDEESSSDSEEGGVSLENGFKINEDYAKRFEHNKKREELQRLEEKFQEKPKPVNGQYGDKYDDDEDSSSGEDEDDDGFLATEALDAEISATLQAIRNKDPRVYDEKITFYKPIEEDVEDGATVEKPEKPVYIKDYHRENLLAGRTGADLDEEEEAPRTFVQEQDDLKRTIVKEMHAAVDEEASGSEEGSGDDDGFLKAKSKPEKFAPITSKGGVHPSRAKRVNSTVDVTVADNDPETFLSNFMSARAWVPGDGARFQPLESDDEEEDERAEKFESAYNLRFEDPKGSNETLKSYARDIVAAKTVRREEPKGRKKLRELERERKDAEKKERDEERARLRKLKIDEMEQRLKMIKKAAGLRGKSLKDEDWTRFVDGDWDDASWEKEMMKRFGDNYYADHEEESEGEEALNDENGKGSKKKKLKKPTWDDDIDIKDIIPDFVDEDENENPAFTLTDSENEEEGEDAEVDVKAKSSKDRKKERADQKKASRLERQKLEDLVDNRLDVDGVTFSSKSKQPSRFRYRETSPSTFGLTTRDILMADDTALNQWAGLKKMATFRDAEKKRKDKKRLGKKARLREWRKETFGNEDGPEVVIAPNASTALSQADDGGDIIEGSKKKKRSRKSKTGGTVL